MLFASTAPTTPSDQNGAELQEFLEELARLQSATQQRRQRLDECRAKEEALKEKVAAVKSTALQERLLSLRLEESLLSTQSDLEQLRRDTAADRHKLYRLAAVVRDLEEKMEELQRMQKKLGEIPVLGGIRPDACNSALRRSVECLASSVSLYNHYLKPIKELMNRVSDTCGCSPPAAFMNASDSTKFPASRWKFLQCRCGKDFTAAEVELLDCVATISNKGGDDDTKPPINTFLVELEHFQGSQGETGKSTRHISGDREGEGRIKCSCFQPG